jgi:hypothetical protein
MAKRALLVGAAEYDQFESLPGCAADVAALEPLLSRQANGAPNFDCRVLVADAPGGLRLTRALLEQQLSELLAPGAETALFYFAGHGALVNDELVLVTSDGSVESPGVSMAEVFAKINASRLSEVVVVLDCCYAGRAGAGAQLERDVSTLREGVSILAGSRGSERAAEIRGRGLFSDHLCAALSGKAADRHGRVDLASVYQYVSQACSSWEQRPIFKLNVQRLLVLRECERQARSWQQRAALAGVAPIVIGLGVGMAWWPPVTGPFFNETGDGLHGCRPLESPCEYPVRSRCPWGSRALGECGPRVRRFNQSRCSVEVTSTDGRVATALLSMQVSSPKIRCEVSHCRCEYLTLAELIAGGFAQ